MADMDTDTITGAPSLESLSKAAPKGPWAVRPQEFDDWGYVRGPLNEEGFRPVIFVAKCNGDAAEQSAARRENRQPRETEAIAVFLARLENDFRAGRLHTGEALAQALAAAREKTDWRDISTAPRDRTHVLVAVPSLHAGQPMIVGEAYFRPAEEDGSVWDGDEWWWAGTSPGSYHDSPIHETNASPTYWMPLPAPPTPARTDTAPGGRADG